MFYINYIKFKNDAEKTRQVALLVSLTLTGAFVYFVSKSLLGFILGRNVEMYEYSYLLVLAYLLINVYLAFQIDGVQSKQEVGVKETIKQAEVSVNKKVINGKIVDDFIFNNVIAYNVDEKRESLVPEFGNDGLEVPEDVEDKEPEITYNHEEITFIQDEEIEKEIHYESENNVSSNKKDIDAIDEELSEKDVKSLDEETRTRILRKNLFDTM